MSTEDDKTALGTSAIGDEPDHQSDLPIAVVVKKPSMKDRFTDAVQQARATITTVTEHENTKAVIDWSKKTGGELVGQAQELGRDMLQTDLGKAATKGAAVGAVAGIPLPVIGPIGGALVGAGVGAWLNIKHGVGASHGKDDNGSSDPDDRKGQATGETTGEIIDDLKKLQEVHEAGIITDEEFAGQKAKLLKRI